MWELGEDAGERLTAASFKNSRRRILEWEQDVGDLLTKARLLHVGDLAAAAVGNAGLRDLAGVDGVVALNVFRPHDAGDDQFADFKIDADFLLALDHEIAVRQQLGDHGGDVGLQRFLPVDRALAVAGGCRVRRQQLAGGDWDVGSWHLGEPEEVADAGIFCAGAAALGLVRDVGLVGDVDLHRENVADLMRALILEECA